MTLIAFMESMGTSSIPLLAAFFIGLMTAISPCPLATNITAIAYISKQIDNSKHTVIVSLFYTLGRMFTYVSLAALIVWFEVNIPPISLFLQKYWEGLLGPLLIIVGIVMLDIVKISIFKANAKLEDMKEKLAKKGFIGSFLLGVVFALAFCPLSGVLFFGMLIPLAMKTGDAILIPSVFAIATGLPVIILSFILVYSVSKLGKIMNRIQTIEKWMRKMAAITFILVGIYYTAIFLF
jgi:cytochrome c-type biogenesis protein